MILVGVVAGVVSVSLVGSLAVANALRRPVADVLRYGG